MAPALEVQILAEFASLKQDLDQVTRLVGDMSGSVGRNTRAVNDNFRSMGDGIERVSTKMYQAAQTSENLATRINATTGVMRDGYQRTERDVEQFGAALDQLRAKYSPQYAAIQQYKAALDDIRHAHKVGAISADEMGAAIDRQRTKSLGSLRALKGIEGTAGSASRGMKATGASFDRAGSSAGLASHHLQNLSFQLQDIFIGLQGGQKPMTVFLQQGSQIGGIMQQASIGVGGLTKQLVKMSARWAPLGIAVGGAALAVNQFQSAVNDNAGTDAFVRSLNLTEDELKELGDTAVTVGDILMGTWDLAATALTDAFSTEIDATRSYFDDLFAFLGVRAKNTANQIIAFFVGGFNGIRNTWSQLPAAMADVFYSAVNFGIRAINSLIKGSVDGINGFIQQANGILGQVGLELPSLSAPQIAERKNEYAGAAREVISGWKEATDAALGVDYVGDISDAVSGAAINRRNNRLRGLADELRGERSGAGGRSGGRSERAKQLDEEAKALERATKAAQDYADALSEETAKIGKTAIEIKKMEIAAAAAAAPTEKLRQAILDAGMAWETATRAQADSDFDTNVIQPLRDELQLLGLVGPEREMAALALEEAAFKADLLAKGVNNVNEKWEEYLRLRGEIIDGKAAADAESEALARLNDELRYTVSLLSDMGSVGGAVGGILGVLTGNTSAIGGPLGDLLNIGFKSTDADGNVIAKTLGDELSDIFGKNGVFGETMTDIFGAAGTGLMAGRALFGEQSFGEQLGSSIGGIAGNLAGEAIGKSVGGLLGKAGGPLGSIAGGLLGGLVGKLFQKKKYGGAQITGVDSVSTFGNDGSRRSAAGTLAGEVISGLEEIADLLGADIGNFNTSIGIYKDKFRVRTDGGSKLGGYKGSEEQNERNHNLYNFGEDAASAVEFAIADAVKDGALLGLGQAEEALIKGAKDIQRGIQDALKFRSVFDRLAEFRDPLGFAIDQLNEEFTGLIELFERAGASAEQYADLEELYGYERAEILKEQGERSVASLKELLSDLTTNNSALSLRTRQASALDEYSGLADRVRAGDTSAYDDFANAASTLLSIERELFGSTKGYFDRLDEITTLTKSRIAAEENVSSIDIDRSDKGTPFDDAPAITNAVERQTGELAAHLGAINENNIRIGNLLERYLANDNGGGSRGGPALHYAHTAENF